MADRPRVRVGAILVVFVFQSPFVPEECLAVWVREGRVSDVRLTAARAHPSLLPLQVRDERVPACGMVTTVLGLVHLHAPTSQTRPPGAEAPPPPPPPPPGVASATADDGGGSRDTALAALVVLWFVIDIQSVIFHHARFWDVLKRHRRETVDDSLGVKMAAMY